MWLIGLTTRTIRIPIDSCPQVQQFWLQRLGISANEEINMLKAWMDLWGDYLVLEVST